MTSERDDAEDAQAFGTLLAEDMIFGVRRRERLAWVLAITGMVIGAVGVGTAAAVLPLKETQAFLAIVDKDTGIAARTVQVAPAGMAEAQAVAQSLLFNYVTERETFDPADNDARILAVWRRSDGQAKASLETLWDEHARDYPPRVYGSDARAAVRILAINPVTPATAQVRFEKTLRQPNGKVQTGKFTATLAWVFAPKTERALTLVWENPLGFMVTGYRVDAEALPEGN